MISPWTEKKTLQSQGQVKNKDHTEGFILKIISHWPSLKKCWAEWELFWFWELKDWWVGWGGVGPDQTPTACSSLCCFTRTDCPSTCLTRNSPWCSWPFFKPMVALIFARLDGGGWVRGVGWCSIPSGAYTPTQYQDSCSYTYIPNTVNSQTHTYACPSKTHPTVVEIQSTIDKFPPAVVKASLSHWKGTLIPFWGTLCRAVAFSLAVAQIFFF